MSIISNLFNDLDLSKKEDISSKLKPHNIKKDNICINKIITIINDNLNPFQTTDHGHLYNIANGRSVSPTTANFSLNIFQLGQKERIKFISDCIEYPDRFEKPIKRQKLHTFAQKLG